MAVTTHSKITDTNAESIGRPIFDKIVASFLNEDRAEFVHHFPYLEDWMTVEIFDEAVEVLNRLGELVLSEYSTRSMEKDYHSLVWDVQYRNDENSVQWKLYLDDSQKEILVKGFCFDR